MSIDVFKNIPDLLENPVIVIDSKSNENAKIVMGDLYDGNGKIVTTVLLLTLTSKKGNVLDIIKISSAEGRGHIESLFKNDDSYNVPVRYVDEKRVQNWLNANRLQLPLHSFNSDSANSISEKSEEVNSLSEKISKTDIRHSYKGINKDGIEVYETSEEVKKLTNKERLHIATRLISKEYTGRTARFERNGHYYYAEFDRTSPKKSLYGELRSSESGRRAYKRTVADGNVFDLIERSEYDGSLKDRKNHSAKDSFTDYFDYFIKTVQIDGRVYDVHMAIKKKYATNGGYAYTVYLTDNKKTVASPSQGYYALNRESGATNNSISEKSENVNSFSEKSEEISSKSKKSKKINREALEKVSESQYEEMKKHFGVTRDIRVAGYLLTDGSMLDFSGKHWGDIGSKTRQVDHRDISEVLPDGSENYGAMVRMIANGNIRLMPESGGICLSQPPTDRQRQVLRYYIDMYSRRIGDSDGVIVDFDEPGGDTVYSRTYDKGTDADTVMKDIDNYFRYGSRSELMSFHDGSDIRYSKKNTEYTYDRLISKPDMKLTTVDVSKVYNRADTVAEAKKSAAAVGTRHKDGRVSVFVDDIGREVLLTSDGLRHSLTRNLDIISPITAKIGEILKNSIRINELYSKKESVAATYVLLGAATDGNNLYIVRSVVNSYSDEVGGIDVLYAVNTKREAAALNAPRFADQGRFSYTASEISIARLLDSVNRFFPNILPEDVLEHYGYSERPAGDIKDVVYSKKSEGEMSDRELLANALETTIDTDTQAGQNELKILREYKDRISAIYPGIIRICHSGILGHGYVAE